MVSLIRRERDVLRPIDKLYATIYHEDTVDVLTCGGFATITSEENFLGSQIKDLDYWEKSFLLSRLFGNAAIGVCSGMGAETLVEGGDHSIERSDFGTIFYTRRRPFFRKTLHYPVKQPEDLDKLEAPTVDSSILDHCPLWTLEGKILYIKNVAKKIKWLEEKGYMTVAGHVGPFESAWYYLRGYENFLMDMIKRPSFAKRLMEFAIKPQMEITKMLIEAGVHAAGFGDDLGTSMGPLISPKVYRELVYPWHKRLVNTYHRMGVPVFYHSHGNINLLMDGLINAGIDVIEPLDPEDGMQLGELKEKYGEKIVLQGCISSKIGYMSKEELRKHVEDRVEKGAPGGGFIIGGAIPEEMSKENYNCYLTLLKRLTRAPKVKV